MKAAFDAPLLGKRKTLGRQLVFDCNGRISLSQSLQKLIPLEMPCTPNQSAMHT